MPLTFTVFVRRVGAGYAAETPVLPGWSAAGSGPDTLLEEARQALEEALPFLEPNLLPVLAGDGGTQLYSVTLDEPLEWFRKPPSE